MQKKVIIAIENLKKELENKIPYVRSEIHELSPSIMGDAGYSFVFDTTKSGIGILYWDTGTFEIANDIVESNEEDGVHYSYVSPYVEKKYPEDSLVLFSQKIIQLLELLKSRYPSINSDIILDA